MRRMVKVVSVGVCVLALACGGDDDGGDGLDAGRDAAAMADAGPDASVESTVLAFRFVDPDGAPLADVKVAVDTAAGRWEETSGSDGVATVEVPASLGDAVSITAALEDYVIVSRLGVVLDGSTRTDTEPEEITLSPIDVSLGERRSFTIDATGAPSDGRLCASFGKDGGINWSLCNTGGAAWSFMVPVGAIGEAVNVWLLDASSAPIDFARVDIPADASAVSVDFDGSFDTEPETRTVRLHLPPDPEGVLREASLPEQWQGWFTAADATNGQEWGVATDPRWDGDDLLVDFASAVPTGTDVRYGAAVYTNISSGPHAASFASFATDPGNEASALSLPTLESGDRLDGSFTIAPPMAIGDETLRHQLRFLNSGGRIFWMVVTDDPTSIDVPELPTEYDTEVSFPFPGASGTVVALSFTALAAGEEPGVDRDFHYAQSEPYPVTF